MKYYRIRKEFDNVRKACFRNNRLHNDGVYIGNELYTEKEWKKHKEKYLLPALTEKMCELVEISKNNTYWFFGARFEVGKEV